MLKDVYCDCGHYLTIYFSMLGRLLPAKSITVTGIPCIAKDCTRTYTLEKKVEDSELTIK